MATDNANQQIKLKDERMLGYVLPMGGRSFISTDTLVHGLNGRFSMPMTALLS